MSVGQSGSRTDELSVDEPRDLSFMRREWAIQRISWVVMLAVVAAAVIGLLGSPGFASTRQVTTADGSLSVEYGRVERHHAPSDLIFEVAPGAVVDGEIRLWISRDYIDTLSIDTIFPEPEQVVVEPDRIVYVFAAGAAAGEPLTITLKHEHDGFWRQDGALGLVNGASLTFTQLILP